MKLCRFDETRLGLVEDAAVRDVTDALQLLPTARWPLPASGDLLIGHLEAVRARAEQAAQRAQPRPVSEVRLYSPVANPTKLIAAPLNYRLHIDEAVADKEIKAGRPKLAPISETLCFLKAVSSLVGPGEGIVRRFPNRRTDHEIELAVVIGQQTRDIPHDMALECVAGYCIGLDMTVRGKEERSIRKSVDTYSVLGPWLVTRDEIADPDNLNLSLSVNGELRQESNTEQLIFDVRTLISKCSEFYTLYPGDVIFTGTPSGVGPVQPGDVLDCYVEGIGSMQVSVRGPD